MKLGLQMFTFDARPILAPDLNLLPSEFFSGSMFSMTISKSVNSGSMGWKSTRLFPWMCTIPSTGAAILNIQGYDKWRRNLLV